MIFSMNVQTKIALIVADLRLSYHSRSDVAVADKELLPLVYVFDICPTYIHAARMNLILAVVCVENIVQATSFVVERGSVTTPYKVARELKYRVVG